jgi:hypothetical protein
MKIEEIEYKLHRIDAKINFLFWLLIVSILGLVIIYYFVLTENVEIIKEHKFGYCDATMIDYPKSAEIICTKENMVQKYSDTQTIYGCLNFGEATCLVKYKERRWK